MPTLTIIRGLPGSGKSTLAKAMSVTGVAHVEADMYWEKYHCGKFIPEKLKDAHQWCRETAWTIMDQGRSLCVANTFTQAWEAKDYVDYAVDKGYEIQIVEVIGAWKSIHDVPDATMERMKNRMESNEDFRKNLGLV